MKLLELAEKIVDPWDMVFASTGYVLGFAIGLLSPGTAPPAELGALSAAGGFTLKQVLWRLTGRRRALRKYHGIHALLVGTLEMPELRYRVERVLVTVQGFGNLDHLHRLRVRDRRRSQPARKRDLR